MTPWRNIINPVKDGEKVNAEISNRPIDQLAGQSRHLKEKIESLSSESGRLVYLNAPLSSDTVALDIVYYDAGDECFKPAIADAVLDLSGKLICGPRSLAVGMILSKESSLLGSILQLGRVNFSDEGFDPADMIADPVNEVFASGRFYLSNKVPGKITSAPVMPSIQVGFFTETECSISILHKDLFESHRHHRYALKAKPSASQNFLQNGWTSFGTPDNESVKRVDYYSLGSSAIPPQIIMCLRHPGGNTILEDDPARFEIYNDSLNQLIIDRVSGGIDFTDHLSAGSETLTSSRDWPEYGEWIPVGFDSDAEISFIRADDTYAHTLLYDATATLTTTGKKFRLFLPQDLEGWTNANTFDLTYAPGALYKYLMAADLDLQSVFPPLPLSSSIIELNGASMVPEVDFSITLSGIFWKLGFLIPVDYAPWPSDYSADDPSSMSSSNARNLVLYFIKSGMDALNSVVFSLKGVSPIKVTRCPSGEDGSSGDLQISIDLGLLISSATPSNSETVLSNVSGTEFTKSLMVSEIVAGSGVRIENISTSPLFSSKGVGKVRISIRPSKFEGEVSSIALRNAKEMIAPFGTYIDFILPAEGASGITAQFKLPNFDIDMDQIHLNVLAKIRGSLAVSGGSSNQTGIFKVVYHVLRPSFRMSQMTVDNAVALQYWTVTFPPSYVATTILADEWPNDANNPDIFEINAATLTVSPGSESLVVNDDGFKAGDQIIMAIDRVDSDGDGNVATYPGRIGFIGLRWALT